VYEVTFSDEATAGAAALPQHARKALADLVELLAVDPEVGRPYRGPSSDLRTIATAAGELLVVWLVLETQQRVEVLRLLWLGDTPTE
jgi:plasmid stabilization system protein ParE